MIYACLPITFVSENVKTVANNIFYEDDAGDARR